MPKHTHRRPAAQFEPTTVPIAFIHTILSGYKRYGRDASSLLRRTQIAPAILDNPGALITWQQFQTFYFGAVRELEDETVGCYTRPIQVIAGLLWRAALAAPTLGLALRRWFRYQALLIEDVTIEITITGQNAVIALNEHSDLGARRDFACVTWLKVIHGFASWLIDSRVPLIDVTFPYPRPPHGALYALYFPGKISFGREVTSLSFDRRYLELPVVRDDQALRRMLKQQCNMMIVQYRRDRLLSARVREQLRADLGLALGVEGISRALRLSTRSLHRHLREEGTSFQAIKNHLRCEWAMTLLTGPALPVKVIAKQLRFADDKAFARAFKQWTGQSPSTYRRVVVAKRPTAKAVRFGR
ncbi:AraC-like DNA-binding protein [Bradyrhizobium sp. AZCC 1678]|uniref:AraC family transcriptional regulator n=1 Tax=Bradyrhizobium sp. AZCC 1678 TaxID=3117030 RepID=UPI002FF200E4